MLYFIGGIILLVVGYFTYGRLVEKIIGPDDRPTPGVAHPDGVDYLILPNWKNMLIQLLNIAGVGPVIGVILGIKFGAIVFLIIPIGNIIGGAVHDFVAGMMSIRKDGANLPKLVDDSFGPKVAMAFTSFMTLLLLLVVAVFINIPASLIDLMKPDTNLFWPAVVVIFIYYICATMFPVDKIIGKIYPLFGALLLIGSTALFIALLVNGIKQPELLTESAAFKQGLIQQPIIPCLFVTIACGILSGFHATQSPIIARTMASERYGRRDFYGMMIAEGIIAMIWAAGGLAIYNLYPKLMAKAPALVLNEITTHFLGSFVGGITVIAVIILAITSGDTAMRSLRLSIAECCKFSQVNLKNRFIITLPLIAIITLLLIWSNLSAKSFNALWNYFAWGNQVLAVFTLFSTTVWLSRQNKNSLITLLPGIFMMFIVTTFIIWTSPEHQGPWGVGLELNLSYLIAGILTAILTVYVIYRGRQCRRADLTANSADKQ
ncbi:MAG: carbon starvation protein A [Lentisphaeria bacterium]|nr:carbon starvation protein A [Lentisphaeria bacterium]